MVSQVSVQSEDANLGPRQAAVVDMVVPAGGQLRHADCKRRADGRIQGVGDDCDVGAVPFDGARTAKLGASFRFGLREQVVECFDGIAECDWCEQSHVRKSPAERGSDSGSAVS